jgi:hypothetical protein
VREQKEIIGKQFKEIHINYNRQILYLRSELEQVKDALRRSALAERSQQLGRLEDIRSDIAHGLNHLNTYGVQALTNLREICNNVRDTVLEVSRDITRHIDEGNIEQILKSANDSRNECKVSFLSITETNNTEIANLQALVQELTKMKGSDAPTKKKELSKIEGVILGKQDQM